MNTISLPQDSLLILPQDCLQKILSYCKFKDALQLASTNSVFFKIRQQSPQALWKQWLYQILGFVNYSDLIEKKDSKDWKTALYEYFSCIQKLEVMPSPGTDYQKYLRWMIGVPANSPVVRQAILGASIMPTFKDSFIKKGELYYLGNEGQAAYKLFSSGISSDYYERPIITDEEFLIIINRFDVDRYLKFFNYILSSPRALALLMAEFDQIECRSCEIFLQEGFHLDESFFEVNSVDEFPRSSRQLQAFFSLTNLCNMNIEIIRFWA